MTFIRKSLAIIITCICFCLCSCNNKKAYDSYSNLEEKTITINNDTPNLEFSVTYPSNWKTEKELEIEGTSDIQASPDSGISIFIDDNEKNTIYIFRQQGHINIPLLESYTKEIFKTTSGLNGFLYRKIVDDRTEIILVFKKEFLGAILNIKTEDYNSNKALINNILKSIEIEQ